jgi:predicted NBD/HSP70 family sugar kinase
LEKQKENQVMKLPKTKFTAAGDMLIQRVISTEYEGFNEVRDYIKKGDARFFNFESIIYKDGIYGGQFNGGSYHNSDRRTLDIAKEYGDVPLVVANDGDVTALAGAMDLNQDRVLGIAMGTSEAAGYIGLNNSLMGWLNELAFVPVDFNKDAMVDEWSGDYGCGVKYFSQDGVIKLAEAAGIELDPTWPPAKKLKYLQDLNDQGNEVVDAIFNDIGIYLGYTLAYYAHFYDIKHVLLLGRVVSGKGGNTLLNRARKVLYKEFPEMARTTLHMPDDKTRRVGQSIAAASLPIINK